eukprot:Phypoly_transcript_12595.p1 GENE.Phypoly_transcript_12595~~Phypoly_transcript_12595.p1  ORF type:complete len:326 (+),score=47.11 Phypoly_transcript_12595:115-1092(+)
MYLCAASLFSIFFCTLLVSLYGAQVSSFKTLSNAKLKTLTLSTLELILEDAEGIIIERVPDTPSHTFVQAFIKSKFGSKWKIETDTFESKTPLGNKQFTNIIATHDSCHECDFLVLAAHYDSKYFTDFKFVAATDSAIPCAMLIDIARSLENMIEKKNQKLGVKVIFFDGEEAFEQWTDQDSLYGARHLAEQWEKKLDDNGDSLISKIDTFVLLDLLGAAKPTFYKFPSTPANLHERLIDVEMRLKKKNHLGSVDTFFSPHTLRDSVQDDHIPFAKRGVRVLHLIPIPFPKTWHTHADDRASIDLPTIDALSKILRVFVAEYLEL